MKAAGIVLFAAVAPLPRPLAAQRVGMALGYTSIPGRIGNSESDHGVALRLGVDLKAGRRLTWTVEGGVDRLNLVRRQSQTVCFLPSGGTGTCSFDSRNRDTGWSLSSVLRIHATADRSGPYALLGLGFLSVRDRTQSEARDSTGALLPNFSINGTSSDGVLQGHLGAGWWIRPAGSRFSWTIEGRATSLVHNYSGGLQVNWSPSILLGVRHSALGTRHSALGTRHSARL